MIALWFVVLTTWFFWSVEELLTEHDQKSRKAMELSVVRYCLEQLHRQILRAAELQFSSLYAPAVVYEKV